MLPCEENLDDIICKFKKFKKISGGKFHRENKKLITFVLRENNPTTPMPYEKKKC